MLTKYKLPCSALELYSARCGLLHQQSSQSDLTLKGKARKIFYAWGIKTDRDLQKIIDLSNEKNLSVAVKIEDLYKVFRNGMIDCLGDMKNDQLGRDLFEERAKQLFKSLQEPWQNGT